MIFKKKISLLVFSGNLVPEKDKGLELMSCRYTHREQAIYLLEAALCLAFVFLFVCLFVFNNSREMSLEGSVLKTNGYF